MSMRVLLHIERDKSLLVWFLIWRWEWWKQCDWITGLFFSIQKKKEIKTTTTLPISTNLCNSRSHSRRKYYTNTHSNVYEWNVWFSNKHRWFHFQLWTSACIHQDGCCCYFFVHLQHCVHSMWQYSWTQCFVKIRLQSKRKIIDLAS